MSPKYTQKFIQYKFISDERGWKTKKSEIRLRDRSHISGFPDPCRSGQSSDFSSRTDTINLSLVMNEKEAIALTNQYISCSYHQPPILHSPYRLGDLSTAILLSASGSIVRDQKGAAESLLPWWGWGGRKVQRGAGKVRNVS